MSREALKSNSSCTREKVYAEIRLAAAAHWLKALEYIKLNSTSLVFTEIE
jgi:hypothetical protein